MLATVHELYDKLLNIYKTQYDKLKKTNKRKIKVEDMSKVNPLIYI